MSKLSQSISFTVSSPLYYSLNYTLALNGSSDSNLTVRYESDNSSLADIINGNILRVLNVGTVNITAYQDGDATYDPATPVVQQIQISKGTPTFDAWATINKTYGDTSFNLTAPTSQANYTSDGAITYTGYNNSFATVTSGGSVSIVGAGSLTIRATQAETSLWNSAYVETTLDIAKASQTITFAVISNLYYRLNYTYTTTPTATSGLTVTLSSNDPDVVGVNGFNLNILSVSVNPVSITASQAGDANYLPATNVVHTFSVLKGTPTFNSWATINKTYGDTSFNIPAPTSPADYTSNGAISYTGNNNSFATVTSGGSVTIVGAGSLTVRATRAETSLWNSAYVETTLQIAKASQTINFGLLPNQTYSPNGVTVNLSATVTVGNTTTPITFISSNLNVGTIVGTVLTLIGAGPTDITARATGNDNYLQTDFARRQTVNKASQTITFNALDPITYAPSTTINFTATASSGLPISYSTNNDVLNINGSSALVNKAGEVSVYADQYGNSNYLTATGIQRTLTVNKANQTITFNALASLPYLTSGTSTLSATSSSNLTVDFDSANTSVATVSGTTLTIKGVGSTTITASQAGNINYNAATNVLQTQTITQVADPICFNEGTLILCLNKNFKEEHIPVNDLRRGDLVKTYKHGYRKIELVGKCHMINDPNKYSSCMYKMVRNDFNGLIDDLIVTGGHSILVNSIDQCKEENEKLLGGTIKIDDKYLLIAAASPDFVKLENTNQYTYYHFILENNGNDDERFGVWSNGILSETPSKKQFLQNKNLIIF